MRLNFLKQLIPAIVLTLVVGGFANADILSFSNTAGQTGNPGFADAFGSLNGMDISVANAADPVVVSVNGNPDFPELTVSFVGATSSSDTATFDFVGTRSGIASGGDGQSASFGAGESLSFFFSEDVEINVAEFGGFAADELISFNGTDIDDPNNGNDLEFFDPPLVIEAGNTVTIAGVTGSNVGISTIDFTPVVGVPEPSSAALLGLLGLGVVARRRRR